MLRDPAPPLLVAGQVCRLRWTGYGPGKDRVNRGYPVHINLWFYSWLYCLDRVDRVKNHLLHVRARACNWSLFLETINPNSTQATQDNIKKTIT